jgi:hypothetical protein
MPLLPFAHTPLRLPVCPHAASGLNQAAVFTDLLLHVAPGTGEVTLGITTRLELSPPDRPEVVAGLQRPPVQLGADNDTAVYFDADEPANPRNGQPLYFKRGQPAEWGTLDEAGEFTALAGGLAAAPEPLRLQGDWAETLLHQLLAPLILANMQAANLPPYNRYA